MSAHAGAHHHTNYVKVWALLLGLLVVSVVGPMAHIQVLTLITAFGIALVKAYIVAKKFMHLDLEKPIVHWVLALALVFMVLMYAGISPDVGRDKGQRWEKTSGWHHLPPQSEHESAGSGGEHAPGH
ncbi:MAG: cytochrome C oxidase subunit IV family protein [Candidatus Eisenbacteria bacterium]